MNVFDLFAKITLDTSEYENGLNEASKKTSSFGDRLKSGLTTAAKAGVVAVGAATTATTAFAASSVKTGMTFDSSMSQVMATMGYSVDELNKDGSEASKTFETLRKFAMEMGSTTAFSASESADALNYMALAGYDAETSMKMLPNVLNLAAAGGIELASASDMVTDAQSALGLTLDETSELVDKMAKASSKSNTSVAQLGEAILTVGGTAKNLAGGTTELSTALGILADNGVKGAEGGTALRNIILSLGAPTDKAAKLMSSLGLEVYDANGNMRPLNETFGDLDAILSTMTQGEQTQVLNSIFNKVDLKSVNALLANTGERFDELSGYIDNATGAAENMAAVQLDNLSGDMTLFKSALEGAQIVLSDQLTPTLRGFVQFGSEAISTLSTAFQEGGLTGAMEALGTILSDGLNMVIEQLPQMVDAGMQLLGALGQGLLDNLPAITDAAIEIVLMLVDGLIEAIPALAEGAVQLITGLANGIGEALPELIPKAVEAVATFLEGLTNPESLNNLIEGALKLIGGLGEGIIKAIPILIEYGPEIVVNLVTGIISALPQLIEVGGQLILGLIEGLIQGVLAIPDAIAKVVTAIVDGFKALFGIHSPSTVFAEMGGFLIEGLLQGISQTWESIVEFFSGAAEALINFLGETWDTIKEAAGVAWEAIKEVFVAAWDAIKAVWDTVVGVFQSIADGIRAAFETVTSFLGDAFSAAWSAITTIWDTAVGFFSAIWDGISSAGKTAAEAIGSTLKGAWDAITGVWDGAVSFFSGIASGIVGAFSDIGGKFLSIGSSIVDGLKNGIANAWNSFIGWLNDKVGGIVSGVKSMLGIHSPSTVFAGIGENMALGLAEGWDDEYNDIKRKIENGMSFGTATVGLNVSGRSEVGAYGASGNQPAVRGGDTFIFNSPKALDPVSAAREMKKAKQQMALGYGV